jgi:O-antigen/teichoic acid export membrane protein
MRFPTASLFLLDGLANLIDFAFHFWMGRALIPSDFAVLQTINSIILVYVTASGVFQPVVGRFVAEARATGNESAVSAIFRIFLSASLWLGLGLMLLALIFSDVLANWLNLPVWSIQISALLIFLSTLRPVAAGALQGQERFISFGLSRLLTALARLVLAGILVHYGFNLKGALIALPFGWLVGVSAAFVFIGKSLWIKHEQPPPGLLRKGLDLSLHALIAYIAFMSLTSLDLIWVNRTMPDHLAGAYASLVLMRRVIALLPGVAVVVMFPRIAGTLAQGRLPDRLLINTASIIIAASGALTLIYFLFSDQLILNIFGETYLSASPLLGWMGVALMGISLSSIWLNYYLAGQPLNYVFLLCIAVALEWFLLTNLSPSLENAVLAFGIAGWFLTASGLALYLWKFRPALQNSYKERL